MEKIVKKFNSFEEAEKYDIDQQIRMTAAQRLAAARLLKKRCYRGKNKDIRAWHRKK
jgi:hypothetical protein